MTNSRPTYELMEIRKGKLMIYLIALVMDCNKKEETITQQKTFIRNNISENKHP